MKDPLKIQSSSWNGGAESPLFRTVRQRTSSDCGVACLAMAAGVAYERAHQFFADSGLIAKRGRKLPLTSNFKELRRALAAAGRESSLKRFQSWESIGQAAILKVNRQKNGNWHWVYSGRHEEHGLYLLDPASDLPAFEQAPLDLACQRWSAYVPDGCFIDLKI